MLRLRLFLFQEIDDESLIIHYEVICKTLCLEVVAKVFSPIGVEGFENSKLGGGPATGPVETPIPRRTIAARRFGRRRRRRVPMSSEDAT